MANQDGFLAMLAAHGIEDGEKVMRRILAEEMVRSPTVKVVM